VNFNSGHQTYQNVPLLGDICFANFVGIQWDLAHVWLGVGLQAATPLGICLQRGSGSFGREQYWKE